MNNLIGSLEACLPPALQWLKELKITKPKGLSKEHWNLVPVVRKDDKLEFLSSEVSGIQKDLEDSTKKLGWQVAEKTQRVVVGEYPILLVAQSSLNTNSVQLARQLGLDAASELIKAEQASLSVASLKGDLNPADVFEGYCLGMHSESGFKSKSEIKLLSEIEVDMGDSELESRQAMAEALVFTKWLQDAPSNFIDPEQFAAIAHEFFGSAAQVTVLGRKEMQEKGMGSFLSVAQGSPKDPKLVTIEFKGKDPSKTVALVGKGVTFDAGGINIKPSAGLEDMKYDMSGAANVYGAAYYLSKVQSPVNVVCAIGAVENMVSGDATRPGDVVRSLSGKTIEILNTDAEGRLVLADVLTHVIDQYKPQVVLDIATLTGAVLFALGHVGAAYMTSDEDLSEQMMSQSKRYGESLWRLPLWPELVPEVQSDLADVKNIAKPGVKAGTIMGGHFLQAFVKDKNVKWAHIDIAGAAWTCGATGYPKSGGSAFGVRTLLGAVLSQEL